MIMKVACFLADGDEAVFLDDLAGIGIAAAVRRADPDPVRLRRRQRIRPVDLFRMARAKLRGGDGIENDDHGMSVFRA
jgi:hypothetical protein